jgi:hypothetical protein
LTCTKGEPSACKIGKVGATNVDEEMKVDAVFQILSAFKAVV